MKVERVLLSTLVPDDRNARKHDHRNLEEIKRSLEMYGQHRAFVVQRSTNKILIGNGMFCAMKELGWTEGDVFYVDDDDAKAAKRALSDNRTAELAEWDDGVLAELFDELGSDIPGWDDDEIDSLSRLADPTAADPEEAPSEAEEQAPVVTQRGDIWMLGKHRLMCGDSCDVSDLALLMNGEKADMVLADPPYGMRKGIENDDLDKDAFDDFNARWIPLALEQMGTAGALWIWGQTRPLMQIWADIIRPLEQKQEVQMRNLCRWNKGGRPGMLSPDMRCFPQAGEDALLVFKGWEVSKFGNSQADFFKGYAPILERLQALAKKHGITPAIVRERCGKGMYSHWFSRSQWMLLSEEDFNKLFGGDESYEEPKSGKNSARSSDSFKALKEEYQRLKDDFYASRTPFDLTRYPKTESDVWNEPQFVGEERPDHPTPKPPRLIEIQIMTCSRLGDLVFDPFGGSGTTLIVAEKTGRRSHLMELDPKYCDLIIRRWQKAIGEQARLEGDNRPFEDVAEERTTIKAGDPA